RIIMAMLNNADPGARQAILTLMASGRIQSHKGLGVKNILKLIIALRVVIGGVALAWLRPEARRTHAVRKAEQYIGQVRANVETARTLSAHLAIIDDYAPTVFLNTIFKIVAPTMIPGLLSQGIVDRWLNKWLGVERGTMRRLLRGI